SRSGSTIVGGMASGVSRQTAAKFSFLMSAIATVGSLVFKFRDLLAAGGETFEGGWAGMLLGMLAAAVSGYLAIRWMLALIQRVSLKWFGLYTAVLGLLVLADQLFFGIVFDKIV
ncbi:MAG: undecaprenyl-diphosphate phosphatase, partial [Christensenellales bacterium]|nr:undecaprenyl-diphosphate phosphatase [Christensenellales bacterium]